MNGQSASTCWSCEASLRIVAAEPLASGAEPTSAKAEEAAPPAMFRPATASDSAAARTGNEATIPSARAPREDRESARDRWAVPVLNLSVDDAEMASQYPGSEHFMATPPAPRRGWQVPALIAGLLVLVAGGAWLIVAGVARDAQESVATSAAVLRTQPIAPMPDAPAPAVSEPLRPHDTIGAGAAPTVAAPTVAAPHAGNPVSVYAAEPPPNPSRQPKMTLTQRGKARTAPQEPIGYAQPAPGQPTRPAAPIGPCTPTVAALGLC
ncbi:MAG: hypothetical protein ABI887_12450 [Burkholderiales bacterium]